LSCCVPSRCCRDPISVLEKFNVIDSASIFDRAHAGRNRREPKESALRFVLSRKIAKTASRLRNIAKTVSRLRNIAVSSGNSSERRQLRGDSSRDLSRKRGLYYLSLSAGGGDAIFPARFVTVNDPAIRSPERPKALNYV